MARRPRLCIVSAYSYPLFNPNCPGRFGGSEVRVSLIAKELARRGHFEVSLLVWDHGQPHLEIRDGVKIYSWLGKSIPRVSDPALAASSVQGTAISPPIEKTVPRRSANPAVNALRRRIPPRYWLALTEVYEGFRGAADSLRRGIRSDPRSILRILQDVTRSLAFGFRRSTSVLLALGMIGDHAVLRESVAVLKEIDADIYMVPGNHKAAADTAFFCRQLGKKYVFLAGSDIDYSPDYKANPTGRDLYRVPHYLKVYCIETAAAHIAQQEHQQKLLLDGYGRSSAVTRNPIELALSFPRHPDPRSILWVGKSDERVKRPSMILNLARKCPQYSFTLVMAHSSASTHALCLEEAAGLPNVTLLTDVSFPEVEKHFAEARLFVNTSSFEGFPNTFLQAAKYGVPIVAASVDPGGMLSIHGCGFTCGDDFDDLEEKVHLLMTSAEVYAENSRNCTEYVRTHHDKDRIVAEYEQILLRLIVQESSSPMPSARA